MTGGQRRLGRSKLTEGDAVRSASSSSSHKRRSSSSSTGAGGWKLRTASASAPRIARTRAGSVQRARSLRSSAQLWWRSAGFLLMSLRMTAPNAAGTPRATVSTGSGSSMRCLKILLITSPPSKGALPVRREVHRASQAVEIAALIGLGGVAKLFGTGVVERAQHRVRAGDPDLVVKRAGKAHVEQLHVLVGGDHDVGRLDVAVDQARAVGGFQSIQQLEEQSRQVRHS